MRKGKMKAVNRVMAVILSFVIVLFTVPLQPLSASAATEGESNKFVVSVTANSENISGAAVTIECSEYGLNLSAQTDDDGLAGFDVADIEQILTTNSLDSITVNISVTKDGYIENSSAQVLAADNICTTDSIELTEVSNGGGDVTLSVAVTGNAEVEIDNVKQATKTVPIGTEVDVTITPDEGYYIKQLTVGGQPVSVNRGEAYTDRLTVNSDMTISAEVATVPNEFTVSASASEGGTITLNGTAESCITIDENDSVGIAVTAAEGYHLKSVSVNGAPQALTSDTSFSTQITVTENIEIVAEFVEVYTVTVTYSGDGTVEITDPATMGGTVTVENNTSVTLQATPAVNYRVSKVVINDENDETVTGENDSSYQKTLVADDDYTVVITFAPNVFSITMGETEHGSVTAVPNPVEYNGSCEVTVTPDDGYAIASVSVNGTAVSSYSADGESVRFTVSGITEAQTIDAVFTPTESASVNIEDLFNSAAALRSDAMTYIYANDGSVIFTTDKDGIIIYDESGQSVGGGLAEKTITISRTTEISKIKLFYKGDNELSTTGHIVEGITPQQPLKIVIDNSKTKSTLTPDEPNAGGFYNDNFYVKLETEDCDDYSGIGMIEYFVTATEVTGDYDDILAGDKTDSGTLYTYTDTVENSKTVMIPITAADNDSDYVVVWVRVTDRAGNKETIKTEELKVCVTAPRLISVSASGTVETNANAGCYQAERTVTLTVYDRASAFDETAATNGIVITANDSEGNDVLISKPAMITWKHNGDNHSAEIVFSTEANYTWSFSYKNKAELDLDETGKIESGTDIYSFSVDKSSPRVTVSIDAEHFWSELLSSITFGIWKNYNVTVSATADDDISGVKEVAYYKSNSESALSETELENLYANGSFASTPYTVGADEKFVVYARAMDNAGNARYVSTNGIIYDCSESVVALNPEVANEHGLYNGDVKVAVTVNEKQNDDQAYSGIKTVSYQVVKNKGTAEEEVTQEDTLYTFDVENPSYGDLKTTWSGEITVDSTLNSSDDVKVIVTATDNAGNIHTETVTLAINTDDVEASITLNGTANKTVGERGYFSGSNRVATIVITDRASAFDETAATTGVTVNNSKGQVLTSGYTISTWTHNGNEHTATVTFNADENFSWSYQYTNFVGATLNQQDIDTGSSVTPFEFTVDNTAPTGSVTVQENTWDKLLSAITFGIYSKVRIDVSATYSDATSPFEAVYYKASNSEAKLLSKNQLDQMYEQGKFKPYEDFSVTTDEKFVVYLRVTDYAGNFVYICSDGAVLDTVSSEISISLPKNNSGDVFGISYADGIIADVKVTDPEPYSGIKTVDYKVIKDGDFDNPTQFGRIYPASAGSSSQTEIMGTFSGKVTVDPKLNDGCNIVLYVTATDNAGNTSSESKTIDIDMVKPKVTVSFNRDNAVNIEGSRGYFSEQRTATIKITERTHHFSASSATGAIKVSAEDANGGAVSNAYDVSKWTTVEGATPDSAVHTATVTFRENANYTWSISYRDNAGNQSDTPSTSGVTTPYDFTIDTEAPTGKVTATTAEGRTEEWETLKSTLTFGIWSNESIGIEVTSDDTICDPSGNKIEYYKVSATSATDGTTALTAEQLDNVTNWQPFTELKIDKDEQFVVYVKVTDLAGNYTYLSTNGLIVDGNAPLEETIAPTVSIKPQQPVNGIYNKDVKVDLKVSEPMVGGTYSGLKLVWYEVRSLGKVTQGGISKPLFEFTETDPKQEDLLQTWTGSITVDSKLNNSNDVEIIVYAKDNSLNGSDKAETIKLDITKPTVMVSYDNNSADSTKYFKDNRTATITVTERNFDAKDVKVNITNSNGVVPVISNFTRVREGTGNLDDSQWAATITYAADGDYTFDIDYTDMAGNHCESISYAAGTAAEKEFTIDKTVPTIAVSYDNNDVQNGSYYKSERTATITVTEHNFDSSRVTVNITAENDGSAATAPTVSGWSSGSDGHTATVHYADDAHYTFDISVIDQAGNTSANYTQEAFYVDTTPPEISVTGVSDKSANKGDVMPVISCSDTNADIDSIKIALTGANRKEVTPSGSYYEIHNGKMFAFDNFAEEKEFDDIYTLTAAMTDRAGNTTEETIMFSVNRFGSTYAFSQAAEALNGTYAKSPIDVEIIETNADELSDITVTMFKDGTSTVLKENEEYTVTAGGGNGQWYHYTYTVFAENFAADGVYSLTVESDDKAGNKAKSNLDTKGAEMTFGIDSTLPIINVENLESKTTYALEELTVNMSVMDNLKLARVVVELDGEDYRVWSDSELEAIIQDGGNFSFDISGDSTEAHRLIVYAVDAAGNGEKVSSTELPGNAETIEDFYVTTNLWVRYYTNRGLLVGSIAAVMLVIGSVVFAIVFKKRKSVR